MDEKRGRMEFLAEELIRHRRRYYELDAPEISDYEYDQMAMELARLEEAFPQWKRPDS